ncbi:HNH endonuclease [Paenibacillus sp. CAU 1523]|uniref:HNH endonuclease n=2 Tax=Paenibacillus arenosi TaxID=2774142 RepID=A0ABR9B5I3_9BACL|nr:HNH endonuclease [Paenibacillus arenosi]
MSTRWHGLEPGDVLDNDELRKIFKCSPQGGMRRSKETNSLVIVSNHVKSLYDDRWIDDVLHYTGMGKRDDQSYTFMQNKTLAESNQNGVEVYLFEVFKLREYVYRGRVELAHNPYQEQQADEKGNMRNVWVFPVKLKDEGFVYEPSKTLIYEALVVREKKAKRMTDQNLRMRAETASKKVARKQVVTTTFERDIYVAEYVKRCAKGVCQLCDHRAPFENKQGEPYLETHHIVWLARGGDDSVDNTVALCPNCHRKMHILDSPDDISKLISAAKGRNTK